MDKLGDMDLFVRVVKLGGLAVAGREVGLSPARVTARINNLEEHYQTRLLNRTTRKISITDAGRRFYESCERVLAEVAQAEALLNNDKSYLFGSLRMTAPSDFGRQYVAPALSEFVQLHPSVIPYLHVSDGVSDLVEYGYDLAVRYGNLPDSGLIVQRLANNRRVLVASPAYLEQYGAPKVPDDLAKHTCLLMERLGEPLNRWQFQAKKGVKTIKVSSALSSNDGEIIRLWALAGRGIAYKSLLDVQRDIDAGNLQTVLDDFARGFQTADTEQTGLHLIYPDRRYLASQVTGFIDFFKEFLSKQLRP